MEDGNEAGEIIDEFLIESLEGIDQLDQDLVLLEKTGGDTELLSRIFRCVHTIKGTCGFVGFGKLESVTHVGENLLSRLRDGTIPVSPAIVSALLSLVDAIREMLGSIEATGAEGETDYSALTAQLTALVESGGVPPVGPEGPAVHVLGELLVQRGDADTADVLAAIQEQSDGNRAKVGEILVARGVTTSSAIDDALEVQSAARSGALAGVNIRVDVGLLDKLMNLVGELVLARNQILQTIARNADPALAGPTQRLNLITTELQTGVMKTRMQPIGNVWGKFPRVVRDLAQACGKEVTLELSGAETELDKTIIEAIKDPLTHIVRNSVDHGIETAAVRVAAGKPASGTLSIAAFHEGGKVIIEIRDDGRGIDAAVIRAKAVEKGVIAADVAAKLSEHESLRLIFAPGFSTAARVTNVSGRGVGMDVVRTNIERIGGTVDVSSVRGAGTTLRIKIPLTLAIIPGLMVSCAGNRYAIPQASLLELVRLEGDDAKRRIEHIYDAPVYRLRGKLLPLVHLNHALGLTPRRWDMSDRPVINIVVLQADGTPFGVVVDSISDTEEIVVKPLGPQLKAIPAYAGATIMGDGRVALILDVLGLANAQGVRAINGERAATDSNRVGDATASETETLLVFGLGSAHRVAVPLLTISRLEEFTRDQIEHTGTDDVVQYRGDILPLVHLADLLAGITPLDTPSDPLQVIVCSHDQGDVGFVVDRIVDIVETPVHEIHRAIGTSLCGSAIVQGKVTDVLDVQRLLRHLELTRGLSGRRAQELAGV